MVSVVVRDILFVSFPVNILDPSAIFPESRDVDLKRSKSSVWEK